MAMHELAQEIPAATGPLDPDAPLPGEAMVDFAVRGALLTTLDRLQNAMEEYGSASADLADAAMAEHELRADLDHLTARSRVRLYADGVPGANEPQRQAYLAYALATDGDLDVARNGHEAALNRRTNAEHLFRVADTAQKALRARVYALTALLARE